MNIHEKNALEMLKELRAKGSPMPVSLAELVDKLIASEAPPLCNLCGLTTALEEGPMADYGGLIDASVGGGFNSTPGNGNGALDDMTSYRFSLCEFCCDWLFERFQIPPQVSNTGDSEPEVFRPAFFRVQEDNWRKMKHEFLVEKTRRDAARTGPQSWRERHGERR